MSKLYYFYCYSIKKTVVYSGENKNDRYFGYWTWGHG